MKKNIYILLSIISLSFLLIACKNILPTHDIWVMECENGRIEIQIEEENSSIVLLLTAFPDEGYILEKNNIYIYNKYFSDIESYRNKYEIIELEQNQFHLEIDSFNNLMVSAIFTKR